MSCSIIVVSQCALIGVRLLFEGGRLRSGSMGLLFKPGDYSRAASDQGNMICSERSTVHAGYYR